MRSDIVQRLHKNFEDYVNLQNGVEFWFARDLQVLLGYTEWRNFLNVIEKAKESCKNSNHVISDHFVDVNKMVAIGSGTKITEPSTREYCVPGIVGTLSPQFGRILFAGALTGC